MWKTFYVKPNERALLYHRSDFQRVLEPGTYYRLPFSRWRVESHDLNQPEAKLENLELLLQRHRRGLEAHLVPLRTAFNEVALVRLGQQWMMVPPNQLRAFWRGFVEVEIHRFNLDQDLQLPQEFVVQLRGQSIAGLSKYQVSEGEIGLLYVQENFVRPLLSGEYAFWSVNQKVAVRLLDRLNPNVVFPSEEVLIDQHPEFVRAYCAEVQLESTELAIVRYQDKPIAILPPCSRKLFWQTVTIERVDLSVSPKLPDRLVVELLTGWVEVARLTNDMVHLLMVQAQQVGLLYLDGQLQEMLQPGLHGWWTFGHSFNSEAIDLRLQTLEVSGQEILSKDKVPLRLNLMADYRIVDPVLATSRLTNVAGFLYKELQFALRGAVGTRSLDGLLEEKGAIDRSIADHMREKTSEYGIEVESVGVKDIILPGEIKTILSKVVEAEKAAQANVVRRREETAATRSMLNTVKAMEDNPIALRLKELEVLERIAEKIEHINVNGSLDSILTELIRIKTP